MSKNNNEPWISKKQKSKQRTVKKLNRRQFLKVGAAVSASGVVLGASASSGKRVTILGNVAKTSVAQRLDDFPVKITAKCKRFDQKNTIFNRELWDYDLVKKIMSIEKARRRESMPAEKGWTPLDRALNAAGWALDHKFATGSEGGQPHSQAYEWDEPVRPEKVKFKDSGDASKKIKKAARFVGASLVGIARYDPLWTYSRLIKEKMDKEPSPEGRPEFELIPLEFPFEPKSVVVIAVEMDYKAYALSPSALEGAATGLGYSHMCSIGYSVATFIRELGYRAFANGNDVSLSVPYGVAAGLGELGRHGLLITQEFGPRVRLVKVFTELDLEPDRPKTFGAWEFCRSCKRCAESCPSQAIPFDEPTLEGKTISNNPGVLKWYIDPEKCIEFWTENDNDCAICITACPFNKPAMWHHQLSAALAVIPAAPLHSLMAKMDKVFGYGNTHDARANAAFWDEE